MILSALFFSCNSNEETPDGKPRETMDSGTLNIACDASVVGVMDSLFQMYEARFPKVNFSYDTVRARQAMALLLSGNSRAVIVARDYLKDEDSLMKVFNVEKHKRLPIAEDALVFYANIDYPIDTINAGEIKQVLMNEKRMTDIYGSIKQEPLFVINNQNSSEFSNLLTMVTDGKNPKHPYKILDDVDSVKSWVRNNENSIGIGYLSQVVGDPHYKVMRVGYYNDSTKTHQYPQVVHQAYILMRKYPFIVRYYVYLLKDRRDLPFWFATYVAKEAEAQKYFKDFGLVPTYAKFKLIQQ